MLQEVCDFLSDPNTRESTGSSRPGPQFAYNVLAMPRAVLRFRDFIPRCLRGAWGGKLMPCLCFGSTSDFDTPSRDSRGAVSCLESYSN